MLLILSSANKENYSFPLDVHVYYTCSCSQPFLLQAGWECSSRFPRSSPFLELWLSARPFLLDPHLFLFFFFKAEILKCVSPKLDTWLRMLRHCILSKHPQNSLLSSVQPSSALLYAESKSLCSDKQDCSGSALTKANPGQMPAEMYFTTSFQFD